MNRRTDPHALVQAPSLQGPHTGYMPGFGNDFETEALPGALPQGMNSPQRCNYGLYGEQLSGTPFHRAQPPERAHVVLPHPPLGQALAPLHPARPAPLEDRAARDRGRDLAGPVPLGPAAPFRRGPDLAHRHAHHDHGGRREYASGHGDPYLPGHRLHAGQLFLLRRQRTAGGPATGPPALRHRAWHHRHRPAGDRDPPPRPRLPGRGAGGPRPRLRLRELRPEIRTARPRPDRRQLHGQPPRLQDPRRRLRGPRDAVRTDRQVVRPVPCHRDRPEPA